MSETPPRPVRAVRAPPPDSPPDPEPTDRAPEAGPQTRSAPFTAVIDGVATLNVAAIHARLEASLRKRLETASQVKEALDEVSELYWLACKLKNRARAEYEKAKRDHETWLESKKKAATMSLSQEKADGKISKQITKDMVMDEVRATWPKDVAAREGDLVDFQAAVHSLEDLADVFKQRARALSDQTSLVLATGDASVPVRSKEGTKVR